MPLVAPRPPSAADSGPGSVPPAACDPARPADAHELARLHAAALQARRRYPGPVGELVCAELLAWASFGYRLGGRSQIAAIVDDVLKG